MNKQFDKLMKNQNERIKKYYESIKENSNIIFGHSQVLKQLIEESSDNIVK